MLHWVCNNEQVLKEWTRNRVIEIQRFTDPASHVYVKSKDMVADIGTRRCTSLDVIKPGSVWLEGLEWMKHEESEFPVLTASDIRLSSQEKQLAQSEVISTTFKSVPDHVSPSYLVVKDPIYSKVLEIYSNVL